MASFPPLPPGSLRDFFSFDLPPRRIAQHCALKAERLSALRRRNVRPTAHDVAQIAIATNETYDAVLNEFDALDGRSIALLRREMSALEVIPQDANA